MSSRCKSCGADIRWAQTERGRFIPFDIDPVPLGTHVLITSFGTDVPKPVRFEELSAVDGCGAFDRYRCHFDTCRARSPRARQSQQ